MSRCEHNCHLCKNEWLGRCYGSNNYGMDVSMEGDREENMKNFGYGGDMPICKEYIYGGTTEHLKEIEAMNKDILLQN